jgi:hypothetical protein
MTCPQCGPAPDDVIWDGVTLAFGLKYVQESLQPPTVCHELSSSRTSHYQSHQQLIVAPALRKLLRKVVTGRSLVLSAQELHAMGAKQAIVDEEAADENEGEGQLPPIPGQQDTADVLDRMKIIPQVVTELSAVNVHAGSLFQAQFGINAILSRHTAAPAYRRFFMQVCSMLCSSSYLIIYPV